MKLPRSALAWLGATLATAATGSIVQTQFNLAAIRAAGALGGRVYAWLAPAPAPASRGMA